MQHRAPSYVHGASATPLISNTIGQFFDIACEKWAARPALAVRHQNVRLTYSELRQAVDRLAAGLLALGLEPGDRIGIWSPNNMEWVLTQFATAKIGLIWSTSTLPTGCPNLNTRSTRSSAKHSSSLNASRRQTMSPCCASSRRNWRRLCQAGLHPSVCPTYEPSWCSGRSSTLALSVLLISWRGMLRLNGGVFQSCPGPCNLTSR